MVNEIGYIEDTALEEKDLQLIEAVTDKTIEHLQQEQEVNESNIEISRKAAFMTGASVLEFIKTAYLEFKAEKSN